jgi:hypothetical protein
VTKDAVIYVDLIHDTDFVFENVIEAEKVG